MSHLMTDLEEHLDTEHSHLWRIVSHDPRAAHQRLHDMTQVDGDEQYHLDAFIAEQTA